MADQPARRGVLELLAQSQPTLAPAAPTCHSCGYSLGGLERGATCPECGAVSSEFGALAPLERADRGFRARAAAGASVAGWAGLSMCACIVAGTVSVLVHADASEVWIDLALAVVLVHAVVIAAGIAMLAAREVRGGGRVAPSGAFMAARFGSGASVLVLGALAVLWFTRFSLEARAPAAIVAGLALLVAGWSALALAAELVARIPNWTLKHWFEDLQVGVPLVGLVGVCIVVGPLLSVALWSVAMLRLARAVRGATGGGGPAGRDATSAHGACHAPRGVYRFADVSPRRWWRQRTAGTLKRSHDAPPALDQPRRPA